MMEQIKALVAPNKMSVLHITNIPKINIFKAFDCGQCFRFDSVPMTEHKYAFGGVAHGKYVIFAQDNENELYIYGATPDEYEHLWREYLALDLDYEEIDNTIINTCNSEHMRVATEYGSGIRILRQDPWECLISFIISQNNNIPRIKKIVCAICKKYGSEIVTPFGTEYAFPTPEQMKNAGVEELFELRMGFRAKYIYDAVQAVLAHPEMLDEIKALNYEDALMHLCKIKGVGAKVASCVLLFGYAKTEAFPIDVQIKRTLEKHFPSDFNPFTLGKNAGIAQQYLFYYEKYNQNS